MEIIRRHTKDQRSGPSSGYSLIELLIVMTILLVLLGLISSLMFHSMSVRNRQSRKTDGMTSALAAINVLSKEIGNAGFGITNNGVIVSDSNSQRLHIRTNLNNSDAVTNVAGEDLVFYYDPTTESTVRFDRFASNPASILVNRVSELGFQYLDYEPGASTPTENSVPSSKTARVRVTITVRMDPVAGAPADETVTLSTEVALRNSNHLLKQQ